MSAWTAAALYVLVCAAGISIWCGCEYVRDRRAEAARFDADMEELARSVGVLPGEPVELDPNHRSPLYDHIAHAMAATADDEWEQANRGGWAS